MTQQNAERNLRNAQPGDTKQRLIEKLLARRGKAEAGRPAIPRRSPAEPIPLSFSQEQVWAHSQIVGGAPIYNEAITIRLNFSLDVAALEKALVEILRRHEIWRTTFGAIDGNPIQIVQPCPPHFPLPCTDLRPLPRDQREQQAVRLASEDARRPFDLATGPLVRAVLVRMEQAEYRLYMTFHQIIFDAVSAYRILMPELSAIYTAYAAGEPSPLPDLPLQYADFAAWQRKRPRDAADEDQRSYWRQKLSGELPVTSWPNKAGSAARETHSGAVQRFTFDSEIVRQLRAFCHQTSLSPYMVLLASYAALLSRYTGKDDILIGGFSAGRAHPELESIAGYFVNPFGLRLDLSGDPTFADLTRRSKATVLDALANQDVPFQALVDDLRLHSDAGRNPIFQIALSQQPLLAPVPSGWHLTTEEVSNGASKMDMVIVLDDGPGSISGPVTYNSDLFDASTIDHMIEHWQILLAGALADLDRRVSQLPLLTPREKRLLLIEWNATHLDFPRDFSLHQLIEAQAERTPDAVAVKFQAQEITYRELNRRSNQVAHYLRKIGVGPGSLAGVCMERSAAMLVALLGILKAGAAYLPLDPAYPQDRLAFMVQDSRLQILITDASLEAALSPLPVQLLCLDRAWPAISCEKQENPPVVADPLRLAYVIYTSGSTGKPQGVQIPHRALVNLIHAVVTVAPGLTEEDRVLANSTISFDIAAVELFAPLAAGAQVIIAPRQLATDPQQLARFVDQQRITLMQATPVTWRMLIDSGWPGQSGLRMISTGEALPATLAAALLPLGESLWNMYGPTETTVWSAMERVQPDSNPILIGRPLANTETYILDRNLQLLPVGAIGELYIGGEGLARGYLHRPELTSQRFVPHPFRAGSRLYKTGDLARFHPDGRIQCLGRTDRQVKVGGHRIELDEIENSLRQHRNVSDAVVTLRELPGRTSLVAYVVLKDKSLQARLISDFLKQTLPLYMLPELVIVDRLPLTPSGKLDRKAISEAKSPEPEEPLSGEPTGDIEKLLAQLWKEALHIDEVSVYDNFFDLGGHSLSAVQVLGRLQSRLGVRLKPQEVAFQSLGQLAAVCRERMEN